MRARIWFHVCPLGLVGSRGLKRTVPYLASFKLSYVSPDNHKIKKNMMKIENKKWSLEAKNRLREIFF